MLSILKSALNANSKEMGIVSNNIANANSTGFKKSSTNFEHIYSTNHASDPDAFSGQGVNISDPRLQMSQGALQATGGALDLAVTGQGFFTVVQGNQIETPFFTRDGSFLAIKTPKLSLLLQYPRILLIFPCIIPAKNISF